MKTTKKKAGKAPRKRLKHLWYASQTQFCVATGKAIADVKRAARDPFAGKEYFRVSRVSSRLVEWLDKNPAPAEPMAVSEKERLQTQKLLKENRKLDFEYQLTQKKYILLSVAQEGWAKGVEAIQKVLSTYLHKGAYNKAIREMKRELEALDL